MQGERFRHALSERLVGPREWMRTLRGEFTELDVEAPAAGLVTARLFDPFDATQTRGSAPKDMWSYRFGAELNSRTRPLRNTVNRSLSIGIGDEGRVLWFGGKLGPIADGWTDDPSDSTNSIARRSSTTQLGDWLLPSRFAPSFACSMTSR